jgi:hypothetical protein
VNVARVRVVRQQAMAAIVTVMMSPVTPTMAVPLPLTSLPGTTEVGVDGAVREGGAGGEGPAISVLALTFRSE